MSRRAVQGPISRSLECSERPAEDRFLQLQNGEKPDDWTQNPGRDCCCVHRHGDADLRARCGQPLAGKPISYGTAAAAIPRQKLFSRSGFRATVPRAALRLEHRQGPVLSGWPRPIAPTVWKLKAVRRFAENFPSSSALPASATAALHSEMDFSQRVRNARTEN